MEQNRLTSAAVSGSGAPPSNDSSGDGMTLLPLISRQFLVDTGLESYFPFDPYDLPRSREWVDPIYRKWEDVPRPAGMAEEEPDDQEITDASEVEDNQEGTSFPTRSSYLSPKAGFSGGMRSGASFLEGAMLSTSLDAMRISPRINATQVRVS